MRKKLVRTIVLAVVVTFLLRWMYVKLRENSMKFPRPLPNVEDVGIISISTSPDIPAVTENPYIGTKMIFKGPENARQRAVVKEFMHAWSNYRMFAWGHDELKSVSRGWMDFMGVGLTTVDSMDTMYIMGLNDEFKVARDWVAENLTFTRDADVSVFEITIRVLGGLLSTFHLTQDRVFLDKALEFGTKLAPCFSQKVPCNHFNLKYARSDFSDTSTAEAGTVQLELRDLGRASGVSVHEKAADTITQHLHSLPKVDGLVANYISSSSGKFRGGAPASIGANGDSYYEYLLKQWIQTGKTRNDLRDDYLAAIEGVRKHLLRFSHPNSFAFVGSLDNVVSKNFIPRMEHLACFLPGTLALGVLNGLDSSHMDLAANLSNTCREMYRQTPTGLSPDIMPMNTDPKEGKDMFFQASQREYMLRPETVESLYYMYYATGKEEYRSWAWLIFESIRRYARVDGGYATVLDVFTGDDDSANDGSDNPRHEDKMETFFLSETLKYLYLIFADNPKELLPLDKVVFNTEAHPLPVYTY